MLSSRVKVTQARPEQVVGQGSSLDRASGTSRMEEEISRKGWAFQGQEEWYFQVMKEVKLPDAGEGGLTGAGL